ncbi:hypothetical protein CH373_05295 [Leptospira perolatii]|uniref:ATP-grasp domain-containing protein n=1 Tax=Leptospira perolatii TaxID=2023191 RepID=A0A2M9ZQW6_9LEPT|nr:ATP-dependent carboxylate-amine ligase [Leptospira perolatii]PJZ70487.1 hypothetical protein CH360_05715 [Leptospira perolatii]PJZ74323.1 hypothetical protein CH373_05295 [Leptospira perolatii]
MNRKIVALLHQYQLVGSGVQMAFPEDKFDVRIFTIGSADQVFRSDVPIYASPVTEVKSDWSELLAVLPEDAEIVTNDESCLKPCQEMRISKSMPVRMASNLATYSNKLAMKERLSACSIGVPRFQKLELAPEGWKERCTAIFKNIGPSLVIKPDTGGYNEGITKIDLLEDFLQWSQAHLGEQGWHVEEFVSGRLFHANAFVLDGKVVPVQVGAYTNPPLEASQGFGLGSITLPWDHPIREKGILLNEQVVQALGSEGRFVIHTEFFMDESGRFKVIDVAARAPGALVSDIAKIHSGVHLEAASYLLQIGEMPEFPKNTGMSAGWLWSPPKEDGSVSTVLTWNRTFEDLLFDLERTAEGMGTGNGSNWLRALYET